MRRGRAGGGSRVQGDQIGGLANARGGGRETADESGVGRSLQQVAAGVVADMDQQVGARDLGRKTVRIMAAGAVVAALVKSVVGGRQIGCADGRAVAPRAALQQGLGAAAAGAGRRRQRRVARPATSAARIVSALALALGDHVTGARQQRQLRGNISRNRPEIAGSRRSVDARDGPAAAPARSPARFHHPIRAGSPSALGDFLAAGAQAGTPQVDDQRARPLAMFLQVAHDLPAASRPRSVAVVGRARVDRVDCARWAGRRGGREDAPAGPGAMKRPSSAAKRAAFSAAALARRAAGAPASARP